MVLGSRWRAIDVPRTYRIRVQGHLDGRSASRWVGMTAAVEDEAADTTVTTLTGTLTDQSALTSVLNVLYDLGFALLSVECLPEEGATIKPHE